MSSHNGSRDYYYSNSRDNGSLPRIRDVLSDVLDQPARPGRAAYGNQVQPASPPSRSHGVSSKHPSTHPHCELTRGYHSVNREVLIAQHHSLKPQPSRATSGGSGQPGDQPSYTYGLYRHSDAGELLQKKTSTSSHFPQRPVRLEPDISRRCVCDQCGERFDRPSALETHSRTHTGERPFQCSYAGCTKAFSIKSNMRRHERTHEATSAFVAVGEADYYDSSRSSTYYESSSTPSSSAKPSSYFYKASRK